MSVFAIRENGRVIACPTSYDLHRRALERVALQRKLRITYNQDGNGNVVEVTVRLKARMSLTAIRRKIANAIRTERRMQRASSMRFVALGDRSGLAPSE